MKETGTEEEVRASSYQAPVLRNHLHSKKEEKEEFLNKTKFWDIFSTPEVQLLMFVIMVSAVV